MLGWGQHGILEKHNSLEGWVKSLFGTKQPGGPAPVEVAVRVVVPAVQVPVLVVPQVVAALVAVVPVVPVLPAVVAPVEAVAPSCGVGSETGSGSGATTSTSLPMLTSSSLLPHPVTKMGNAKTAKQLIAVTNRFKREYSTIVAPFEIGNVKF